MWIATLLYFSFASNLLIPLIVGVVIIAIALISNQEGIKDPLLLKIESVLTDASQGGLEGRITSIDVHSPYKSLAWSFNNLLDQVEAYMRESIVAIQLAEKGLEKSHDASRRVQRAFLPSPLSRLTIRATGSKPSSFCSPADNTPKSSKKSAGGPAAGW